LELEEKEEKKAGGGDCPIRDSPHHGKDEFLSNS